MSRKLQRASAIAVAAMIASILVSADGSGAAAQPFVPAAIPTNPSTQAVSQPVVQQIPDSTGTGDETASRAASLGELVASQPQPGELSRELNCLANAIYFEAKSETLAGQLAVGRVVVARSKSGRFPNSYCGVVYQPSQFSFVQGQGMPVVNRASRQWKNAVAVAQIAHDGSWASPVEGALYFHAARVAPGWRLTRLGQVDNHVFYR